MARGANPKEAVVVAGLHLLLALVATFPLVLNFGSQVAGGGDTVQFAWNLWWTNRAAHQGNLFPYYTQMLYHPGGVTLAFHALELLNGWLASVLQSGLRLSLIEAFNTIMLLTFAGSGLAAYLLSRSLGHSPTAALAASLIFTYAPVRMGRVFFGAQELYSTHFIPIVMLAVHKLHQTRQLRYAVLAGASLAATAALSLYLAYETALVAAMLFLGQLPGLWAQRSRQLWFNWLRGGLVFGGTLLLLAWPHVLPQLQHFQEFNDQADTTRPATMNSADLLGFFVPDAPTRPSLLRAVPHVERFVQSVYSNFYGNPAEKTVFLGYVTLSVVAASLWVTRPALARPWLVMAAVLFVLALGPVLQVAGRQVVGPLPYAWLSQLPLISFGRAPSRMAILLMLAVAMLAGYGLSALEARGPRFKWLTLLCGLLIFVEYLIVPLRLDARFAGVPAFYQGLGTGQYAPGAVLDVPIDLIGAQGPAADYMLYQTRHQQPIVSGYISRTPSSVNRLFDQPFLNALRARTYGFTAPFTFTPAEMAAAEEGLRSVEAGYVILHKAEVSAEDEAAIYQALVSVLAEPIYVDDRLVVWDTTGLATQ